MSLISFVFCFLLERLVYTKDSYRGETRGELKTTNEKNRRQIYQRGCSLLRNSSQNPIAPTIDPQWHGFNITRKSNRKAHAGMLIGNAWIKSVTAENLIKGFRTSIYWYIHCCHTRTFFLNFWISDTSVTPTSIMNLCQIMKKLSCNGLLVSSSFEIKLSYWVYSLPFSRFNNITHLL